MSNVRLRILISIVAIAVAVIMCVIALIWLQPSPSTGERQPTPPAASSTPEPVVVPEPPVVSTEEIAALPPARYNAVIPGLLRAPTSVDDPSVFTLTADAPLFGEDLGVPVARFEALNFLNEASPVVQIDVQGAWSLVLTPSRQQKPSETPDEEEAAAQTAAWVPTAFLNPSHTPQKHVVISSSRQTMEIRAADDTVLSAFDVTVGAPETPTPAGVVGYLQAQYLDPAQGQTQHRIQLTSLHATASDEPYRGGDGGLIGIHFGDTSTGAVSHGCIRGAADAVEAVDALPAGTLIYLVE